MILSTTHSVKRAREQVVSWSNSMSSPSAAAASSLGSKACADLWYAVRVRSRFEFVTAEALRERGYEEFLPAYRSKRYWSDRVKEIDMPLFPGYVFCRFDAADPYRVLNSPGVVHIVSAGKRPLPVEENEVVHIQAICRSGLPVQPWPFLRVGRRIRLERGPLAGLEGIVLEMKAACRIVASLTILQRSVAAEIERDWIRPVS
jgi:transcription antitermination factor NusG